MDCLKNEPTKYDNYIDFVTEINKICENINFKNAEDRRKFGEMSMTLFENWIDPLPDFKNILNNEDIENLLSDTTAFPNYNIFIDFLVRTGYKYQTNEEQFNDKILMHTTAIHMIDKGNDLNSHYNHHLILRLFEIYHKFDINYIDEDGLSHLHLACQYGFIDVVIKFIEFGHDPNLKDKTGDTPLHYALMYRRSRNVAVFNYLLQNGADINLANEYGLTSLHIICQESFNYFSLEFIFDIMDSLNIEILINSQDNQGKTPLHYCLEFIKDAKKLDMEKNIVEAEENVKLNQQEAQYNRNREVLIMVDGIIGNMVPCHYAINDADLDARCGLCGRLLSEESNFFIDPRQF
ncbi:hypothetical protein TKK_0017699 [Trichogramma kaykai]